MIIGAGQDIVSRIKILFSNSWFLNIILAIGRVFYYGPWRFTETTMSYCRWSSDDWKSDVYTYAHVDGTWTTHIAGRRRAGLETLPPSPYAMIRQQYSQLAFVVAYRLYHDALRRLPFVEIDLPYVGETFKDVSPQACAATLKMLRVTGYHVPDGVIEELEAEVVGLGGQYTG